jgi:hypothetical protein
VACGCNDRPPPRRETVEVPTAPGVSTLVRLGECHPAQLGWALAFGYSTKVASTRPEFILRGQDVFLGTASDQYGDSNGGILCAQGGRLFCPWPTLELEFFDALGSSAATKPQIQIVARPVLASDHGGASTVCRGISSASVANGNTGTFTVPLGALEYWVARPDDGGVIYVTAEDGLGSAVENFVVSTGTVAYPDVNPAAWRDVPQFDAGTASAIEVTSAMGTTQKIVVHWKYDLSALR